MREVALLFNVKDKVQIEAIKAAFYLVKVPIRVVPKERYGATLREMAKDVFKEPPDETQKQELDGQMIVFVDVLERKLYKVVDLMHNDARCGSSLYKAILTKTNQKWNAFTLLEELKKEHAAMHRKSEKEQK